MNDPKISCLIDAAERAIPFLRDEANKYEDDGSNEPLEVLRDLKSAIAAIFANDGESVTTGVLAVLDESIAVDEGENASAQWINERREARAAIAELIEAARNASATLGHAYHTVLIGELAENAHTDYQRLDAAIAKATQP